MHINRINKLLQSFNKNDYSRFDEYYQYVTKIIENNRCFYLSYLPSHFEEEDFIQEVFLYLIEEIRYDDTKIYLSEADFNVSILDTIEQTIVNINII